jgi:hypothetical protein
MLLANLAAYSTQIACVAIAGGLLTALLRVESARVQYGIWRTLLDLPPASVAPGTRGPVRSRRDGQHRDDVAGARAAVRAGC